MDRSIQDKQILDIGGSRLTTTYDDQLPKAFAKKGDFPKEIAYTKGMDKWNDIADTSYQTTDEMDIIQATAERVVSEMANETTIIDLGAANSAKYEHYVREFIKQGKTVSYVPLDLDRASLTAQIGRAKAKFPKVKTYGLWGSFHDGDAHYVNIKGPRLFLSMGSIFYNGPEDVVRDRCQQFRKHLGSRDRLIVGQDSPAQKGSSTHASYGSKQYDAFFTTYLGSLQAPAGISQDPKTAWTVESRMEKNEHYFAVTATRDMVCEKFANRLKIPAGTTYRMFPSWKFTEDEIHGTTRREGLDIVTLGKAKTSGMRQYMISKATA